MGWCSNPKNSVILTSRSSPGTLGRDLIVNGGDRTIPIEVRRRIKLTGQELEQYRAKEKSSSSKLHSSLVEEALDDESDSDTEMEAETGKKQTGFFKSNKSRYPMFPCIEEKIKYDDYGEIIRIEDFLMDTSEPVDELAETVEEYEEDVQDKEEVPTKCVSTTQNFQINCGIQFIDFEGR